MSDSAATALLVGMIGAGVIVFIISIIMFIAYVIGLWKCFEKMGEECWKALIPFYNMYVIYKNTWIVNAYWVMMGLLIANNFIFKSEGLIRSIVGLLLLVVNIASNFLFSRSFGYGCGMTVLMTICPSIGTIVVGFGSSQYRGNTSNPYSPTGF